MKHIILILSICVTMIAHGQNIDDKIQHLLHPKPGGSDVSLELMRYGKNAIPSLVQVIDFNGKAVMGYHDPLDSNIPDAMFNSAGMRAA